MISLPSFVVDLLEKLAPQLIGSCGVRVGVAVAGHDVSDLTLYYYKGPTAYPQVATPPPLMAVEIRDALVHVAERDDRGGVDLAR